MEQTNNTDRITLKEKIGYALGDGAANIAWRGVSTFLFIYYTDVFGLSPVVVGVLLLIARFSDGISDVVMGIIADRTSTKYGKFRPWILWSAIPLGIILGLLFTNPDMGATGKLFYAYLTYIFFTLIYTVNNIPYGALMAVMSGDDKERTCLGSFRMAGAFGGGMIVQGALLFLVTYYGNINPTIEVNQCSDKKYHITVSASSDVPNATIKTENGFATFRFKDSIFSSEKNTPVNRQSFALKANKKYTFIVEGESNITSNSISIIDQNRGYSYSIYVMSIFLTFFMFITFYTTKERVQPPKHQENNLKQDLKDLITNTPWVFLILVGLLFNVYNSIKQGIVVIYFTHYLNNQLLSASYLVSLMIVSIAGALATALLGKKWGKHNLFIYSLLFSGGVNALLVFCKPTNIEAIFVLGMASEFAAAMFPTLFFVMLGDAADYSEFKNGRRATGLIYSAGSFATKLGGGIAGAIIGLILGAYHYDGQNSTAICSAIPGIVMLMSWVPASITIIAAGFMSLYPLTNTKMDEIIVELSSRRGNEI
jgi:glycoside/pentoside/hexuronide:cation symporter, GPH family